MNAITPHAAPVTVSPYPAPARAGAGERAAGGLRTMSDAQHAEAARATINGLPVSSSINSLTDVLAGITLTLGAGRFAAPSPAPAAGVEASAVVGNDTPAPRPPSAAAIASRHYAAIDAATR